MAVGVTMVAKVLHSDLGQLKELSHTGVRGYISYTSEAWTQCLGIRHSDADRRSVLVTICSSANLRLLHRCRFLESSPESAHELRNAPYGACRQWKVVAIVTYIREKENHKFRGIVRLYIDRCRSAHRSEWPDNDARLFAQDPAFVPFRQSCVPTTDIHIERVLFDDVDRKTLDSIADACQLQFAKNMSHVLRNLTGRRFSARSSDFSVSLSLKTSRNKSSL